LDEEVPDEEAFVLAALEEGPLVCDAEAPAESLALAPTLVSVAL
jgi:hypothetical protein